MKSHLHALRAWRNALIFSCCAWLMVACTAPTPIGGDSPAFDRVGRFAVLLQPFGAAEQSVQGGFAWRDDGDSLQLDLSNPVGSVLARITVRPGLSVLQHADGTRETAHDPDALLAKVWGHAMPVAGIRAWIRGEALAGQGRQDARYDDAGHLLSLQQQGWQIQLSDYDAAGPTRVRLQRHDEQGQWRLRLVIDPA